MVHDVRTNINFCKHWLNSYLSMPWWKKLINKFTCINVDYKELYLRQLVDNAILRNRLFYCKNDNNKLKKQYLDAIKVLANDPDDLLQIRKGSDVAWDLDKCLAMKIASYIKLYQKLNTSIPSAIYEDFKVRFVNENGTVEETDRYDEDGAMLSWNHILDDIAEAFKLSYEENVNIILTEEQRKKKEKGLQLFVKYFDSLWL